MAWNMLLTDSKARKFVHNTIHKWLLTWQRNYTSNQNFCWLSDALQLFCVLKMETTLKNVWITPCWFLSPTILGLVQWFLTFFTYLMLLSKKITRFTPNILNHAAHLLKNEINELLQLRMIYKNLRLLQIMVQ